MVYTQEAAMATAIASPHIPLEDYLHGNYRPDLDYVDGSLEDRHVGEYDHGALILAVLQHFLRHKHEWGLRVVSDVRIRISPTHYRVPDILLLSRDLPREQIITHPPLVCVEILSPEDRIRSFQARVKDYFDMGVKHVWILDPKSQVGYSATSSEFSDWKQQTHFTVEGTPIVMELEAVLREMD